MKKLIMLLMLFFFSITAYLKPVELVETASDSLIVGVDSITADSVVTVDSLVVFNVNSSRGEPEPMRTNYNSLVAKRDSSPHNKNIERLNYRDGSNKFILGVNLYIISYNMPTNYTKDIRMLGGGSLSSFKRQDIPIKIS